LKPLDEEVNAITGKIAQPAIVSLASPTNLVQELGWKQMITI
jgi:hypothetical protein